MAHAPTVDDLLDLARDTAAASLFPDSQCHGVGHWQGVADQGLWLADHLDFGMQGRLFAFVFGAVHDCRRMNDDHDPEHGQRAADWLDASGWMDRLDLAALAPTMRHALVWHDKGVTLANPPPIAGLWPVAALGWDADRSLLGRVGIRPNAAYFSLAPDAGLFRAMVERGEHVADAPACWTALAARALA